MSFIPVRAVKCDIPGCAHPLVASLAEDEDRGVLMLSDEAGNTDWRTLEVPDQPTRHVCPECAAKGRPSWWPLAAWVKSI